MQIAPAEIQALRQIGWLDEVSASATSVPEDPTSKLGDRSQAELLDGLPPGRIARISAQHRSGYIAATAPEVEFPVQAPAPWMRPKFPAEQRAAVGDWVLLDPLHPQILQLLPRRSLLKRAAAGEHYKQQPIAANIDFVLVISGLDNDFNPRRLERYLLLVRASGAEPVLVFTKLDLHPDFVQTHADVDDALAEFADSGVPIHCVNAKDADSIEPLLPYLGVGRSVVLVGSSGAGKSTLTNTLLGREHMKTAEVRATDARGRHTTTHRALIPLPQGGVLIDTPGMRELKPTGEEDVVDATFEDVEALAAQCRFRDCAHASEPGCAVRAALESGALEAERFESYLKLSGEVSAAAQGLAAHLARRGEVQAAARGPRKRHGLQDED
ncbi:MAG: ribosome small subunit-dependent GTPase A [Lysobacteraceae bacterium]